MDGPEDFEAKPLRYFDDMLRCSICRCLMNIPVILSGCDHNFCSECVRGHLRSKHSKNECPLRYCSKPFQERDIIPNKFLQKLIRKYREETRDAILGLEERCGGGGGGGDDEGSSDGEGSEDAHSRSTAAATGNFLRQAAGKAAAGDEGLGSVGDEARAVGTTAAAARSNISERNTFGRTPRRGR